MEIVSAHIRSDTVCQLYFNAFISTYPAFTFKPAAPQASVEEVVNIPGIKVGDKVQLCVPRNAALPGLNWVAWVSRDNEVKVRYTNTNSGTQILPPMEVFKVRVERN